eukprot:scaffold1044_cov332-Prasinococcus_capsulatus_cf.AAC.2
MLRTRASDCDGGCKQRRAVANKPPATRRPHWQRHLPPRKRTGLGHVAIPRSRTRAGSSTTARCRWPACTLLLEHLRQAALPHWRVCASYRRGRSPAGHVHADLLHKDGPVLVVRVRHEAHVLDGVDHPLQRQVARLRPHHPLVEPHLRARARPRPRQERSVRGRRRGTSASYGRTIYTEESACSVRDVATDAVTSTVR